MGDRLAEAFMKQNILQTAIYGSRFRPDMSEREREALAITYLQHLQGEVSEGFRCVRIDPAWSRLEAPDFEKLRGESIDAFHLIVNLGLLLWDGDSEAFFAAYKDKWKANFDRATDRIQKRRLEITSGPASFRAE